MATQWVDVEHVRVLMKLRPLGAATADQVAPESPLRLRAMDPIWL
jgi:hypothetical protein